MVEEKVKQQFIWSSYSKAIFNAVLNTDKNIVVNAVPGSGKTTTLIECSKLVDPKKEALFTAFNKSIVEELSNKLPSYVHCSTLHSLGMRALISYYHTPFKLYELKYLQFIDQAIKERPEIQLKDQKEIMAYKFNLLKAINIVRLTLTPFTEEAIFEVTCYYNIELLRSEIIDVIKSLEIAAMYNRSFSKKYCTIDYVDMIYLPVINSKIKMPQFEYVYVDEVQDNNVCQQALIERVIAPKGRVIYVGDENQAIYGFLGSNINTFNRLKEKPNTITLPLSICYRCPTTVVELAQQIYPVIEPNPINGAGVITYGEPHQIEEGDMVLCRNNEPLVVLYFRLLAQQKKVMLCGSDIQDGLETLVSQFITKDVIEGLEKIRERLEKLSNELKERGVKSPKNHPKYVSLQDKMQVISVISNWASTMKDVKKVIDEMFAVKENCIKLLTVHSSKGMECDNVFYIERYNGNRLLPSPYAFQEWEKVQERNLKYVMLTRCKKSLTFIQNIDK